MRTFTLYLCRPDKLLRTYWIEAASASDAEDEVRELHPDLPADVTIYRCS